MIDRATIPASRAEELDVRRIKAKLRRDMLRTLRRCINDSAAGTHGPLVDNTRCAKCRETHRKAS